MSSELAIAAAIADLRVALPEEGIVSTDQDDLISYFKPLPNVRVPGPPHNVVVHVLSTADVVVAVKISKKHRVPIVVRAGSTGLELQITPCGSNGSICIDMSRMNRILQINESDGDVVVQPGVEWNVLNSTLEEKGIPLFFPLDPALGATIGGIINTGCSGTNAVRYGTARGEWILNVTAVLPSGEVIKTRRRSRKSSAGLDMTKLFVGSEGTLGVITEATVRLAPLLPTTVGFVAFPDVHKACKAVSEILTRGGTVQCAELIDIEMLKTMNTIEPGRFQLKDTVIFKYQGSKAIMADTSRLVEEVSAKYDATGFTYFEDEKDSEKIWTWRKMAFPEFMRSNPEYECFSTDVCVPVSNLPHLVLAIKEAAGGMNLRATLGGHVGDGNFHALLLYKDEEERARANEIKEFMIMKALELDGTCTGEHGVGLGKKQYLTQELGEGTVALMCTIKRTLDPYNLFNPGKLYPEDVLGFLDTDEDKKLPFI